MVYISLFTIIMSTTHPHCLQCPPVAPHSSSPCSWPPHTLQTPPAWPVPGSTGASCSWCWLSWWYLLYPAQLRSYWQHPPGLSIVSYTVMSYQNFSWWQDSGYTTTSASTQLCFYTTVLLHNYTSTQFYIYTTIHQYNYKYTKLCIYTQLGPKYDFILWRGE